MPTRKQRRRAQKERRHDYEYETVWVDPDTGEEVEPPEDYVEEPPEKRENGKPRPKPKAKAQAQSQRGGRPARVPPPPSWQRAAKRSAIIGAALFAVIYLRNHSFASAFLLAAVYTAIFIPAQFMIDRFAHNRWQRRAGEQVAKRPAKRR